jgi:hypothetical protein
MKGLLPAPLVKHLFATQEKAVKQSSRQFLNTFSPGGGIVFNQNYWRC